jgi:hypothetical protein
MKLILKINNYFFRSIGHRFYNLKKFSLLIILAAAQLSVVPACSESPEKSGSAPSGNKKQDTIFRAAIDRETGEKGRLNADHYLFSNERRIEMFESYIKDLKGGYVGVGTDQNLTLAAWAKSDYIWLMDFDDYVVRVNRVHIAVLRKCPDYKCFADFWNPKNEKTSWAFIEENFKTEPDFSEYKPAFRLTMKPNEGVAMRLSDLEYMSKHFNFQSFHNRPTDYNYLHNMAVAGRIRADRGDLTKKGTMMKIADAATKMNLPIRIVYTSNAEEYFRYPEQYRLNILSLPVDDKGYIVRTLTSGAKFQLGFPEGEKFPNDFPFHYNLQKLSNLKTWMEFKRYLSVMTIMQGRTVIQKGFSVQGSTPADNKLIESGNYVQKGPGEW